MTAALSPARAERPIVVSRCCLILRRVLLGTVGVVLLAGVLSWIERAPLLRAAAAWWIVADRPGPADAVAVLGGGVEDRPFAAAAYYRQGIVRRVLISNVGGGPAERLGALPSHASANREVLLRLGVPAAAIETFGTRIVNTHDEVLALHEWAERAGATALIVPTELFTTRRLSWMLHRVFGDAVTIRVTAQVPEQYDRSNWWRDEGGIVAFQNEVLKYLYYRFKY